MDGNRPRGSPGSWRSKAFKSPRVIDFQRSTSDSGVLPHLSAPRGSWLALDKGLWAGVTCVTSAPSISVPARDLSALSASAETARAAGDGKGIQVRAGWVPGKMPDKPLAHGRCGEREKRTFIVAEISELGCHRLKQQPRNLYPAGLYIQDWAHKYFVTSRCETRTWPPPSPIREVTRRMGCIKSRKQTKKQKAGNPTWQKENNLYADDTAPVYSCEITSLSSTALLNQTKVALQEPAQPAHPPWRHESKLPCSQEEIKHLASMARRGAYTRLHYEICNVVCDAGQIM